MFSFPSGLLALHKPRNLQPDPDSSQSNLFYHHPLLDHPPRANHEPQSICYHRAARRRDHDPSASPGWTPDWVWGRLWRRIQPDDEFVIDVCGVRRFVHSTSNVYLHRQEELHRPRGLHRPGFREKWGGEHGRNDYRESGREDNRINHHNNGFMARQHHLQYHSHGNSCHGQRCHLYLGV